MSFSISTISMLSDIGFEAIFFSHLQFGAARYTGSKTGKCGKAREEAGKGKIFSKKLSR